MAGDKFVVFPPVLKEGLPHRDAAAELGVFDALHEGGELFRLLPFRIERRADGHEAGRVVGKDGVRVVEIERFLERLAQTFKEVERPAQKEHSALDAAPLRETRHRLIDDRPEDGGGDIRLARPLIEEGLDIGLGEHAAARGDGIDALRL